MTRRMALDRRLLTYDLGDNNVDHGDWKLKYFPAEGARELPAVRIVYMPDRHFDLVIRGDKGESETTTMSRGRFEADRISAGWKS